MRFTIDFMKIISDFLTCAEIVKYKSVMVKTEKLHNHLGRLSFKAQGGCHADLHMGREKPE